MEKCKDSIWKWGITKFFPQSCHNGFLLAPFRWERLTFHAKFPKKWKPKLQLVDRRCAADSSHPVVALAGCFPGKSPGWDGFPAPTGILLGSRLFPSPHTCSSTLWLQLSQLILVRQRCGSCRDVCVFQRLFLMSKDGARDEIPILFFVAVKLSPLFCPPHRSHHHSSGSSTQEKVPGRKNWEFVYPKAMAVNWLQLFLKIFLGFDHSSCRQQEKTQVKPNPIKKKPKLLIRWILHFLIVNSENILPGICLGEGLKKSKLNYIVNGKEK